MALHPLFRSLTFRLALIYLGLFSVSIGLLLAVTYWTSVRMPLNDVQTVIAKEADALAESYIVDGREAVVRQLGRRAGAATDRKAFHAFIAPDGRTLAANLPSWPAVRGEQWRRFEADLYADGDEKDHEALVHDQVFRDGARLIVGRDIEDIDEREELIKQFILWGMAAVLVLGVIGGLLMSLAVGRRIEAVNVAARRVIAGDLAGRVATRGTGDDFDRLGDTLNAMLARIEALVEAVSRVSDSIAHELRTPLARLQADLEDIAGEDDAVTRERLIEQALDEAARLQSTFDALLRIARIETGRHALAMREVDLTQLLEDAAELYQPEVEAQGRWLFTEIAEGLRIMGDRDLLFQAVCNLLDNAIKHTPAGSQIRLQGQREPNGVAVEVTDDGPGIAEPHRQRVTERFYRAPGTENRPGIGLGLSLVHAVASAHDATLGLLDVAPGLRVRIVLPAAPPA